MVFGILIKRVDGLLLTYRYVGFQLWATDHFSLASIEGLGDEVEDTLTLRVFEREFCQDFASKYPREALPICPLPDRSAVRRAFSDGIGTTLKSCDGGFGGGS